MKIAIDISQVVYGTGVSRYTKNLVENIVALDSSNEYILFGGTLRRGADLQRFFKDVSENKSIEKKTIPVSPALADLIWNKIHRLKIERFLGKIDVLHSSDWAQPPTRAFSATTIHDLSPIKYPELTHPKIVSVHKDRLRWVRRECDKIIVPTNSIKDDLKEIGFDPAKIVVIYEAPDPLYKPQPESEVMRVKEKYGVKGKYLFGVGINARKNTLKIIEAYMKLVKNDNYELVLAGRPQISLPDTKGLHILGHVEEKDLPALYSGASVLVYPSLYEGFGLPILEAFACKTPVVTSNRGSMKEIGQKAVVLVNPEDTQSIFHGIEKAIKNKKDLIAKGQKEMKKYSWEKAAKETLAVYKSSQ